MKKNSKKIISLFLVFVLLFSMSYSAFAAAAETVNRISVTLTSDKKQYKSGEEIKLQTKIKNSTGSKQYVSVTYRATPFAKFDDADKYSIKYAEIENETSKEFSAIAKANHSSFTTEWVQKIYDAVFGSFWSAIYMIVAMFNSNYEPVNIKVDGIPAVVMAEVSSSMTLPGEEEKYKVSFDANYDGAEKIKTQMVRARECAIEPTVEREGYNLIGWYIAPTGFVDFFDFSSVIDRDITVYARWVKIDDTKDSDNDGIIDSIEIQFGSDPNNADSDNDGISDYDELNWLNTNPNDPNDGNGDADNDGLTNAEESALGTNPAYYDSDYDLVSDYDEIHKYKTNPLVADTDGDGVNDGLEIQNGSDPLKAETSFTSSEDMGVTNENYPVSVTVEVVGDAKTVGSLKITPVTPSDDIRLSDDIAGYLGYAYDFSVDGKMEKATITFSYDEALGEINENFQPRIYYFNESEGILEELENQTVTDGKVSAETEHFSTYILLNKVEFDKVWETEIKPVGYQDSNVEGLDVVLVIDSSGSMDWNDPNGLRKATAKSFVGKLGEKDRAAVVDFDSYSSVFADFTSDKGVIEKAIDRIDYSGGTNLSAGISTAINLFTNSSYTRQNAYKYIIMLTDGDGSYSNNYTKIAADNNIVIYTVGLGSGVMPSVLKSIADGTGGKYYFASTAQDLDGIYTQIEFETIDYTTDTNGDGISDYHTKLIYDGLLKSGTASANMVGIDLNYDQNGNLSDDYDGDGLKNGEEIEVVQKGNTAYLKIKSSPLLKDSDYDGYSDYDEIKVMKTSPLKTTVEGRDDLQTLLNDEYTYVDMVHDNEYMNIAYSYAFDWHKKKESTANIINYFYDYASEKTINDNSKAIEKLAKKQRFFELLGILNDTIGLAKSTLDATVEFKCDNVEIKKELDDASKTKGKAIKAFNNNDEDDAIKILEDKLSKVKTITGTVDSTLKVIEEVGVSEAISAAKGIAGIVKIVAENSKKATKVAKFKDTGTLTFANKYKKWMNSNPAGLKNSTYVGLAFDIVDCALESVNIYNTYSKIQANTQAFMNYIDLIEFVSNNGNGLNYIKTAAGDVMKILLDETWKEYHSKIHEAMIKEVVTSSISAVLSICPYTKVAKLVADVAVTTLSLLGITGFAKSRVSAQMIDAISDGCVYMVKSKVSFQERYISFETDDAKMYIGQLAQSRIVGQKLACDYLKSMNMINLISRFLQNSSRKDIDYFIGTSVNLVYMCIKSLNLEVSSNLPVYKDGKWTELNKVNGTGGGGSW